MNSNSKCLLPVWVIVGLLIAVGFTFVMTALMAKTCNEAHETTKQRVLQVAHREMLDCPVDQMRVVDTDRSVWIVRACGKFLTFRCGSKCELVPNGYRESIDD